MTDETKEVAPETETPEVSEIEEQAKKYGWRPKEEFDFAPENWVDAERFMEFPQTQVKVMRDEMQGISERVAQDVSAKKDAEYAERFARLEAASTSALKKQREDHEAKIAQLEAQKRKAVEESDTETYDQLTQQQKDLAPPPEQPKPEPVDIGAQYGEQHPWVKDSYLFNQALQIVGVALNNGDLPRRPDLPGQLAFAEERLKDLFPHKFATPAPEKPKTSKVDGGGLATIGGKGANALPEEARKQGQEFVDMGIFKDLDAYAKSYFEQGA